MLCTTPHRTARRIGLRERPLRDHAEGVCMSCRFGVPCHRSGEQERHDTPARLPHLQPAWQTRGRGVQHACRLDAGSRRVVDPRRGRCVAVRVVQTAAGRSCHVCHVRFPSLRRAPFASVTAVRRVRIRDPVARDSPGVLLVRLTTLSTCANSFRRRCHHFFLHKETVSKHSREEARRVAQLGARVPPTRVSRHAVAR